MKYYFAFLICGFLTGKSLGQTDTTKLFVAPEFKGGSNALKTYLFNYLNYPQSQFMNGKQGAVTATIFVDQNGKIKDVITKGKNEVFNSEVKRVLLLMPRWESGKLNGLPIDTNVTQEVYFSIQDSRIKNDSTIFELLSYRVPVRMGDKEEEAKRQEYIDKMASARALYNKGLTELQNKNADVALDLFIQAEQQGFKENDLYYNRGIANYKTGKKEAACQDWLEGARRGDLEALDLYNKKCK